jgi:stage V sporulation protein D (sporulation-specific penicillin-binding protein)
LSQVLGFTSSDGFGQAGLELYYDKYLKGKNGEILYETDIVGIEIDNSSPTYIKATDGLSVKLTIDFEIQQIVESAMLSAYEDCKAKSAQCIVLDPSTGEILAMSVKPSLDLNELPRDDLSKLNALTRNSILTDVYEPGSTFKILTSAANIEENLRGNSKAFSVNHVFNSSRYRFIDGTRVKCWSNHSGGKHSCLTLSGALNNSCNPIFVDIAISLGKEKMYDYIRKFGYGSVTGIDFTGEAQGMVLPESAVKNVDLARIAFGQTIAVTPLQLALATASAINGGYYYEPHLVKEVYSTNGLTAEIINPTLKNRTISEKASSILNEMLEKVVSEGSGKHAYIDGYRVAGKTGTAQKYENGIIAQGKYVSSFVGYFPANNPKYLALVIIDEPEGQYYGSTVAAPYAKNIFNGIIETKKLSRVI